MLGISLKLSRKNVRKNNSMEWYQEKEKWMDLTCIEAWLIFKTNCRRICRRENNLEKTTYGVYTTINKRSRVLFL